MIVTVVEKIIDIGVSKIDKSRCCCIIVNVWMVIVTDPADTVYKKRIKKDDLIDNIKNEKSSV